uniref:3-oxoacyl-(Acyl-carrier-protein) synthase II n=1 Tax=uncultured bacterium pEAF66 TaxID=480414 RepID=B0LFU0_9BACT|nr:3-oxoacyl-(acyl-carrier-protein) synthase II [uncultured bacterium pEAF66]
MSNRVVITGLGVVSALGYDWETFWNALLAGKSGIRPWQPDEVEGFPVQYAAPVDLADFERTFARAAELAQPMERRSRFGLMAARGALADAGLAGKVRHNTGVAVGSGVPERCSADMLLALGPAGPRWENLYARRAELNASMRPGNDHLAALVARSYGCDGPVLNFSTACAGAAHAIGSSFRMIRDGETDCMLAGGADSVLNLMTMLGLNLIGAPSTSEDHGDKLCRPFDSARSGFVAAEGGAMLVLESERRARSRGARIYAEICGFGSSLDAYRVTAPHPEGRGAALAMRKALADAGLQPGAIGYINAHGTSTPLNDVAETRAIKSVFADGGHYRKLMVSASKSQIGHMIAAAGAPECIATVLALHAGHVPPTLNLDHPDPECDLDYVPHLARRAPIQAALSNSFGFGGLNVSLALRRYQE